MSPPTVRSVAATAAVLTTTAILIHQREDLISSYRRRRGIKGLLRLLWVGDHLPPHLRMSMDELDKVEKRMDTSEEQIAQIEILVEKARLDSVDSVPSSAEEQLDTDELRTVLFQQYPELRTRIAIFSNKLDTLAAILDSVQSHSDEEVKLRKKQLSNRIVVVMNELDRLVASLNL